jgi:transposase InsO family protein
MTYQWIKENQKHFTVAMMCQVLGVSRSGFYDWKDRPQNARTRRRAELVGPITKAHADSRSTYGSPRVHAQLKASGVRVCQNTVAKIMKEEGICSKIPRRFRVRTTDSAHAYPPAKDLLDRQFDASLPDQKWAADITYIPTAEGWLYLAGVIDLCSRKIVGWAMADHLKADLCLEALEMALAKRGRNVKGARGSGQLAGLIHHSDRGVQYACGVYRELLEQQGITCSMSRSGDCYGNAMMESLWGTLKTELIYHEKYRTREQARSSIFQYIECWYNPKRIHSALGYKSPDEFEAEMN